MTVDKTEQSHIENYIEHHGTKRTRRLSNRLLLQSNCATHVVYVVCVIVLYNGRLEVPLHFHERSPIDQLTTTTMQCPAIRTLSRLNVSINLFSKILMILQTLGTSRHLHRQFNLLLWFFKWLISVEIPFKCSTVQRLSSSTGLFTFLQLSFGVRTERLGDSRSIGMWHKLETRQQLDQFSSLLWFVYIGNSIGQEFLHGTDTQYHFQDSTFREPISYRQGHHSILIQRVLAITWLN